MMSDLSIMIFAGAVFVGAGLLILLLILKDVMVSKQERERQLTHQIIQANLAREIVQLLQTYTTQRHAKSHRLFFYPVIPEKRLNTAILHYASSFLPSEEHPLIFIDDKPLIGKHAPKGCLVTDRYIYSDKLRNTPLKLSEIVDVQCHQHFFSGTVSISVEDFTILSSKNISKETGELLTKLLQELVKYISKKVDNELP